MKGEQVGHVGGGCQNRIRLEIGACSVTALLEDTATAAAFVELLPLSLTACCTGVALCAPMPHALPVDAGAVHRGWHDGDIAYSPAGGWLSVLIGDEENSLRYGDQVTLGHIEGDLEALRVLEGRQPLRITLV